jgi:phosphoribosylformylglycinamidine synthase
LYSDIDPYWMAASAIDEALRQITCVGGRVDRTAILDNFCWGNPDKPDRLAALVRAARACYDMAVVYGTPFISGKDSFYNEFSDGVTTIAIPPTLLISAICVMDDVTRAVSMDARTPGNPVYAVGLTRNELGGSQYYRLLGHIGQHVPTVDPGASRKTMDALHTAMHQGLVAACHDCSEGGFAVAAAEMGFAGGLGLSLDLRRLPTDETVSRDDVALFSESNSRFIVEVHEADAVAFEALMDGCPCARVGSVSPDTRLRITGLSGSPVIDVDIHVLKEAWQKPLRW